MKRSLLFIAFLLFCVSTPGALSAQDNPKPNIIFFLVDDMGWQDTSVPFWAEATPFNHLYHTPAMERLAASGMKFTQAYASSVCSPTRVSLMTGMNAARHRVTNWTLRKNASNDAKDDVLEYPLWNVNGLSPVPGIERAVYATPLPAVLRSNGYYTIHCGKAHWGAIGTPGADPKNLGFDVNIAGHAAGGPATYQGLNDFGNNSTDPGKQVWSIPGLEKYWGQDINLSDALTKEAILAMDTARSLHKPFYLYLSHYAIHVPLEADHRYYKKYKDRGLPESEARYASMIEGMDKSLNDILNYVDEKNIAGNTIIIFMSDNGGLSAQARAGKPHTHNAPLNSGKGSAYEGGIREPMIVSWPDVTKAGSSCNQYIIAEDFFPTILSLAGIKATKTVQHVDGASFEDLLKNPQAKRKSRNLYWHFPNNWGPAGPGIGATSTIRSGDWKLIYYYKDARTELFNIKGDIGEHNNLAQKYPAKVKNLAGQLTAYLKEVKAQKPLYKATGKPAPWPGEKASL